MEIVVHTAGKGNWQVDVEGTRHLLEVACKAGVSHVVFISIVGIDKVPYATGKAKLACEDLIKHSGIPWSILRATQFHYGVPTFFPPKIQASPPGRSGRGLNEVDSPGAKHQRKR